ncbi:MAG: EscU/YscU/HrcU family type III secretion system export apparatus switch protein [Ferrovibrio sp.]|uniref:EscU/YscU/HrcU family type III secretion system export apparatus switch protein n=1 Tax=Ferrovibrio sp. TaxID=1917215 RepID=UPI00262AAD92|nr:EscU/YscU/HrcU family type III secretion system export apparatus switch protein [Ferrovibrio sp.]MCW0234242.1 EscU/YscU/HrcU family type III secretion system export apparatus switch protein [Ferrovibrio sp.]
MADPPNKNPAKPPKQKAVALRYNADREEAPRVVATGEGHIAAQIVRIALDNGIIIHKDSDLVEILSKLDIDALIPIEAFAAVAEILSYIYRSQGKTPGT